MSSIYTDKITMGFFVFLEILSKQYSKLVRFYDVSPECDHCFGYCQIGLPTIWCHFEGLTVPYLSWTKSELLVDTEHAHQSIFMKVRMMKNTLWNGSKIFDKTLSKCFQNSTKMFVSWRSTVLCVFQNWRSKKSQWADSWSYAPPFFASINNVLTK
jgi:hypothetical protein